jgi:hypothetical protein
MSGSDRVGLTTDNALLVLYDPKVMRHRVRAPHSWWQVAVKDGDFAKIEDVRQGKIAIWPIGGKSARYTARVRKGELTETESKFVKGSVAGLGVLVESSQLFIGPGERMPGEGFGDRIVALDDAGALLPFENGRFLATVHVLDWKHDDSFFDEDGEAKADAPTDFVITLAPTEAPPTAAPRPVPQLLSFMPKLTAPKAVSTSALVKSLAAHPRVEVGRPAQTRGSRGAKKREDAEWHPAPDPEPPPKPGEVRAGMRVRHQSYGEGTVLFIREGFPKVKVDFRGVEQKVDRSELELL